MAVGVEITYDFTGPESNRLLFWVFKVCCRAIAVAHTEGVNDRFAAIAGYRQTQYVITVMVTLLPFV